MFEHQAVDRGDFTEIRPAHTEPRRWRWWQVFDETQHTRRIDRDDEGGEGNPQ
ncbi:hypothetical protein [Streptomyces sp. NPDC058157]|uniref:hypothetical protein n=1 Tax=Streptomyces sp. NPDC058157 TaxID=3346360 RepID=UPI0036E63BC8